MEYRESNASGYDARYSRLRYTESVGEKYEDGSDNEFFAAEDMSYMEYDEDMDDSGTNELVKAVVSSEDDTSLPVLTFRFCLNPGPFNIKEHSAITIYCGLTLGVTDLMIFMLQKDVFYQPKWPLGVTMLLLGSTIVVGFSIQGILGGYLTRSPDMLFPILLVAISLIRSLNEKNSFGTGGINGTKFVMIVGGVSALPLCYIFPNNQVAHQLGSGLSGLGMLSASFDWSTIVSFFGSPMVIPLWSAANSLVGIQPNQTKRFGISGLLFVVGRIFLSDSSFHALLHKGSDSVSKKLDNRKSCHCGGIFVCSYFLLIVVGYLDPGNPVGNLGARTIGNCILDQSINAAENFKMGHYMKIPPRELWIMQIVGTVVSMFVTIFTLRVVEHNVEDLCMSTSQNWSCTKLRSIITATHIWGLIGPSELFSFGREYSHIWISLGIGSILPVFSYILTKKYPGTWISYIHVPIIFISARMFPPATSASLITAICICFVFNYWVYRYKHAWWTRYNYLLSSGLEFGIVVGGVISVMISSFSPFTPPNWWGNDQLVNCPLSVRPYIVPKPPGS
ncbi:Oligopeptide transporter 5 [Zancudomyces culisetae]|uniref:Oligopeptide transporter 5 n=1 Tax=Zancudomyces culisetae TaxID=1213189 RepID=A0A1R1PP82_ZANCU|nr:Oligopeptide transporter 5 [Zancudomyces culisetae]|eukprot:OMH82777.1 Oligopeptide transporter 5 [Zancudomyces culisetae]